MAISLRQRDSPSATQASNPEMRSGRSPLLGHCRSWAPVHGAAADPHRRAGRASCWSTPRWSWLDARQGTFGTIYIATVGKIRMLSQRLAKAAQQASQGNLEAFKQLRESRDEFAAQMKLLLAGGEAGGVVAARDLRRARGRCSTRSTAEWQKNERNAALVIAEERNLLAPGPGGAPDQRPQPGAAGAGRRGRRAQRADRRLGAAERDRRAAHDAHAAHGEERQHHAGRGGDRPARSRSCSARTPTPSATRCRACSQGSEALRIQRVGRRGAARQARRDGSARSRSTSARWASILGNQQRLVNAKRATFDLFNDSESLLRAAEQLNAAYEAQLERPALNFIVLAVGLAARARRAAADRQGVPRRQPPPRGGKRAGRTRATRRRFCACSTRSPTWRTATSRCARR